VSLIKQKLSHIHVGKKFCQENHAKIQCVYIFLLLKSIIQSQNCISSFKSCNTSELYALD